MTLGDKKTCDELCDFKRRMQRQRNEWSANTGHRVSPIGKSFRTLQMSVFLNDFATLVCVNYFNCATASVLIISADYERIMDKILH